MLVLGWISLIKESVVLAYLLNNHSNFANGQWLQFGNVEEVFLHIDKQEMLFF